MANNKDRIMDLKRRGIITEDEALELLEGNSNQEKGQFSYTDKNGYDNHDIDTITGIKNAFGTVIDKLSDGMKALSKTVDDNVDFTNGFPKMKSVKHSIEKDLDDEFESVSIDLKAGKVQVIQDEKAYVKVNYQIYGAIEDNDIEKFIDQKTKLGVKDGVLEISTVESNKVKADVELHTPDKNYESLMLKLAHGNINVADLQFKQVEIKQLNGEIILSQLKAEQLEASNKNGEIKVLDGKASDLKLDSINGTVRVTSAFEKGEVNLVNGSILITQDTDSVRQLSAKNVNGDIKVSIPERMGLSGRVKTVFGGYKTRLKLDTPFETGKSGAAVVRSGENVMTFELETKSGTIWLKDTENKED
ncbi:MAG: DUF4097 family beta strand repeat-containing protein [Streptococcaceae bacterium]|nr:DUF4097 family beta strand repeat-containing protein [Streptococcaceae bacterium]